MELRVEVNLFWVFDAGAPLLPAAVRNKGPVRVAGDAGGGQMGRYHTQKQKRNGSVSV